MSMIEKLARAIAPIVETDNEIYWASEYGRPVPHESMKTIVRAVLSALSEPTEEMCEAAWMYSQSDPDEARGCWKAMLAAASKD